LNAVNVCKSADKLFHTRGTVTSYYLLLRKFLTTSAFGKQTAAISEFYFRFRICFFERYRCVILHRPTKRHQNRTIPGV